MSQTVNDWDWDDDFDDDGPTEFDDSSIPDEPWEDDCDYEFLGGLDE